MGGCENPALITAGIGQALLTTAFGLTIAIFSLIPYNYFLVRIDKAVTADEDCPERETRHGSI